MISTDLFNHIFERNVNKMKKVINGKMYNTDTAKRMADWSYGYPGNFEYYEEELYKKKTGEFFLYGEGGPRSKYSDSNGSETYGINIARKRISSGKRKRAGEHKTPPLIIICSNHHSIARIEVLAVLWYSLNILIYQDFQGPTM